LRNKVYLAEDNEQWRAVVITVTKLLLPFNAGNFDYLSDYQLVKNGYVFYSSFVG
jgi:hypothetical protein